MTFALSLAAMIYTGPLTPFLSQGIGLAQIGAAIKAVVGPLTLTYRGTLIQPQDVSTNGLLLGPFQGGSFLGGVNLDLLQNVQWPALLAQTPVIATIIGISMLGMLLNASSTSNAS